jgi:hypothetical protein
MDELVAREIARRHHAGQHDRAGELLIEHVARVAASVPPCTRPLAWLHDLLERTTVGPAELEADGLSTLERAALELLTRSPEEPFASYVLRIVYAPGPAGELARTVKAADLQDHIERERAGWVADGAPPYQWALRHLVGRGVSPPHIKQMFLPPLPGGGIALAAAKTAKQPAPFSPGDEVEQQREADAHPLPAKDTVRGRPPHQGVRHGRPRQDEEAHDLHDPAVIERVGHETAKDPEPEQAGARPEL